MVSETEINSSFAQKDFMNALKIFFLVSLMTMVTNQLVAADVGANQSQLMPTIKYSYAAPSESEKLRLQMVQELEALTLPYATMAEFQKSAMVFAQLDAFIAQNLGGLLKGLSENKITATYRNAIKTEINKITGLMQLANQYKNKALAVNILEMLNRTKYFNRILVILSEDALINLQGDSVLLAPLKTAMNLQNEVLAHQLNLVRDQMLRPDLSVEMAQQFKKINAQLNEVTTGLEREYMGSEAFLLSLLSDLSLYKNTEMGFLNLNSRKPQLRDQVTDLFQPMAKAIEILQKYFNQLDEAGWNGKRAFPQIVTGNKCTDLFL